MTDDVTCFIVDHLCTCLGSIPPVCASTRDFLLAKLSKLEKASAASKACPNKPETPQFRSPSTTEETRGEDNVESAFQTLVFLDLEGTGLARANPRQVFLPASTTITSLAPLCCQVRR